MFARLISRSNLKTFLLTIALLALSPIAAFSQFCTDVNQDGEFTHLDFIYLHDYLVRGGPAPTDLSVANVDGFEKVTIVDWDYIFRRHFQGFPQPSCSVLFPPIVPAHDPAKLLSHTQWLDSGVTDPVIILELSNNEILTEISLIFNMYVGGEPAFPDSVKTCTLNKQIESCFWNRNDTVQDSVIPIFVEHVFPELVPLYRFYLYTTLSPSLQRRPISIEFTQTSPAQANPPDSSLITMMLGRFELTQISIDEWEINFNVWEPTITCCFQDRGDLNGDGNVNILDLTDIVCVLFRGCGNTANCPEETDINGDGTLNNILDLTTLVDYIFRGGSLTSCYE